MTGVGSEAPQANAYRAEWRNSLCLSDDVWALLTDELAYRVKACRGMDATLEIDTVAEDLIRYALKRLNGDRGRRR